MATWSEKQASYLAHSDAFINIADGAVRAGKTFTALGRFAEMCIEGPPGDMAVCGKTERTVKRNVVYPLMEITQKGAVRYIQGSGELYVFGRRCWVVGANDVRAEEKARGLTLAGSYCNEWTLYPETFTDTLIDRHSVDGAQILGDCNPDNPNHYLNKRFLQAGKPKDFLKRWRFKLRDNPILWNEDGSPKRYVKNLILAHPPGTLWHKRMILGLWVMAEGAIYQQWDEAVHVVERMPGVPDKVIIGIDYGTSNATVFLALGRVNGVWYVFDEYSHSGRETMRQKTDGEYSEELSKFIKRISYYPNFHMIDPSAASFKTQLRKDGFSHLRDADNEVVEGIRTVSSALSSGKIKILKKCERLRMEFPGYVWDEKKQLEKGKEEPLEGQEDHALDALRYGVMKAIGRSVLEAA